MPTVTLLEKVDGAFSPEILEPLLKQLVQDLDVHADVKNRTVQQWVQVEVSGEDEAVALQLLDREFGLAPESADRINRFALLRGRIIGSRRAVDELRVDVGVFKPKVAYAAIPLNRLQAQLGDGKKLSVQSLIELHCLHDNMPLQIKVTEAELTSKRDSFEAELSEHQLRIFTNLIKGSLDRLIVMGARSQDVDRAVKASRHFRDAAKIESLGLLQHSVVCKLGTDAVGLIPALGRHLRRTTFAPFSPRKILQTIGRSVL